MKISTPPAFDLKPVSVPAADIFHPELLQLLTSSLAFRINESKQTTSKLFSSKAVKFSAVRGAFRCLSATIHYETVYA
jgi:hypothetical protein